MAKTPILQRVTNVISYTVPPSKYAIITAMPVSGTNSLAFDGTTAHASPTTASNYVFGPFVCPAGTVITDTSGSNGTTITGFEYDV